MRAKRKILFVDRDGTLIEEPEDQQVDRLDKLRLVPEVIPALRRILELGYELVMVTNQDGVGTERFPEPDFLAPHAAMLHIFASQGIEFAAVHIDRSMPEDNAFTRKPRLGMVLDYLKSGGLDLEASAVVGDRDTDLELADNMGLRGFRLEPGGRGWWGIVRELEGAGRSARVERKTRETRVCVFVDLDRPDVPRVATGIGFFDHMLEQLGKHGGFTLELSCEGDLEVDPHHTVEDCGIVLGQAIREALGDKRGIGRYGFVLPMDEARAQIALDLGGRSYLRFEGKLPADRVGALDTEMVPHFFRSLSDALGATLHIAVDGENTHHMVEACFKGVARALRQAIRREGDELPSTKGLLA